MSQHDYSLADQAGAAFRSDLNSVLDAIVTGNGGVTEPATKFARMVWLDTTANLAKQRNAANNAWKVRGTLAETLGAARSSNTILAAADHGKFFVATSNFTQTLTAAATLADGWYMHYRVNGGVTVTLDPDTTETVDGATTKTLVGPCSGLIFCTGSAFLTYGFDSQAASATVAGVVELATDAETLTGTDAGRAVTPAGLASLGGLVKIASGMVAAAATLDITSFDSTKYSNYRLVLHRVQSVTDIVGLYMRTSVDGGANFAATAYNWAGVTFFSNSTNDPAGAPNDTSIHITGDAGLGNAASEVMALVIDILGMHDASVRTEFISHGSGVDSSGNYVMMIHSGQRGIEEANNAIRLFMNSGNISTMDWSLYAMAGQQ